MRKPVTISPERLETVLAIIRQRPGIDQDRLAIALGQSVYRDKSSGKKGRNVYVAKLIQQLANDGLIRAERDQFASKSEPYKLYAADYVKPSKPLFQPANQRQDCKIFFVSRSEIEQYRPKPAAAEPNRRSIDDLPTEIQWKPDQPFTHPKEETMTDETPILQSQDEFAMPDEAVKAVEAAAPAAPVEAVEVAPATKRPRRSAAEIEADAMQAIAAILAENGKPTVAEVEKRIGMYANGLYGYQYRAIKEKIQKAQKRGKSPAPAAPAAPDTAPLLGQIAELEQRNRELRQQLAELQARQPQPQAATPPQAWLKLQLQLDRQTLSRIDKQIAELQADREGVANGIAAIELLIERAETLTPPQPSNGNGNGKHAAEVAN